jgi:hypothetical protein
MDKEGDFASLNLDEKSVEYLQDAYDAITRLGLWKELSEFTPNKNEGFMFSSSPLLEKIRSEMKLMSNHSSSTYGWTMREIEFIAKNGWNNYVKLFNK